jgi:hypothetical protein
LDSSGGWDGTTNSFDAGCACDIPAHSYQYSFDPNPDWSAFYAPQAEICAYLNGIAEKYGVTRFIKLQHEVESCSWDDMAKKWLVILVLFYLVEGNNLVDGWPRVTTQIPLSPPAYLSYPENLAFIDSFRAKFTSSFVKENSVDTSAGG